MDTISPCDICKTLTTSLRAVDFHPRPSANPHDKPSRNFKSASDTLALREKEIFKSDITTQGISTRSSKCQKQLSTYLRDHPTYTCYKCAKPTIIDIRRHYFEETGTDEEIILNDLRAHFRPNQNIALPIIHTKPLRILSPWNTKGEQALVGQLVTDPTQPERQGTIMAFAPSNDPPHNPVYYIHWHNDETDAPSDDEHEGTDTQIELDNCTQWSKQKTKANLVNSQQATPHQTQPPRHHPHQQTTPKGKRRSTGPPQRPPQTPPMYRPRPPPPPLPPPPPQRLPLPIVEIPMDHRSRDNLARGKALFSAFRLKAQPPVAAIDKIDRRDYPVLLACY